jgi:transcriptional regulator with XRE-family HTH domain
MARTSLAVIMDRFDVSQGEVSRRSGLARSTVADAYHGARPVTPLTMLKIAKALNVPLKDIDPLAADELDGVVIS